MNTHLFDDFIHCDMFSIILIRNHNHDKIFETIGKIQFLF